MILRIRIRISNTESIVNMHGHCDVTAGGEDNVPGNAAWSRSTRRGIVLGRSVLQSGVKFSCRGR